MPFDPATVLTGLAGAWWTVTRKAMADLIHVQAAVGAEGTFAAWDGSLVSLVDIAGTADQGGVDERERRLDVLTERWNGLFSRPGYALHLVWENDPAGGADELADVLDILRAGAARRGLDLDDLINDRARALGKRIAAERATVALWTRPRALDPAVYKRWRRSLGSLPDPALAQTPALANDDLLTLHDAYVGAVLAALGEIGVDARRLDAPGALDRIRAHLGPALKGSGVWDIPPTARPRWRDVGTGLEGAMCVPLIEQLLAFEPDAGREDVAFGGRRYAPLDVALGPARVPPYEELAGRLRHAGVPLRLSILFESDGLPALLALQEVIATALSPTCGANLARADALRQAARARDEGAAIPRFRASVMTWTDDPGPGALARVKSAMVQAVQGWGDMTLSRTIGDPLETFVASVPGLACAATGPAGVCDFRDMLRFLPLERARHIDPGGALSLRTPDGRHVRHAPKAPTGFNCDLISGIPGRGKSVLISAMALSSLLGAGGEETPFDATIDAGGSIEGFIETVRGALPPDRRHMAGFYRLENTPAFAVNVHDTQLGCRFPLSCEKAFLTAFYIRLLGPEDGRSIDGLADLASDLIDAVYHLRSGLKPGSQPALHAPGAEPEVDEALRRHGIGARGGATWWDTAEALLKRGDVHAAGLAQRRAVPTLACAASALNGERIAPRAKRIRYSEGESLFDAALRLLGAAIARWPILAGTTAFDVAGARIIGVDVAAVAPQDDSASAKKQTALMYMLARFLAVRSWWIPEAAIAELPETVRDLHASRIRRLLGVPKTLRFDEAHRASGLWEAILLDVRETRKKNFHVVLASQLPTDFPEPVRRLANRHWLMSAGVRAAETREIASLYGFGEAMAKRARTALHPPDARGAPFLTLIADGHGFYMRHLYLSLGPMELWAYSTEPRDVVFRRRLAGRVGPTRALRLLARHYPEGSVVAPLRERLREHEAAGRIGEANEGAVMDAMIKDMLAAGRGDGFRGESA